MTGPRKIIDLDSTPRTRWSLSDAALHIYQDKLWHWEKIGCVMCAESDINDQQAQTLRSEDDENVFVCLTHGKLEEIDVEIKREYTIRIGNQTRSGGKVTHTDAVLFPVEMAAEERERIINYMFDEIEKEEGQIHEHSDD